MSNNVITNAINFDYLEANTSQFSEAFNSARPFRYLYIDNFCHENAISKLADEFPEKQADWIDASGKHTKKKWTLPIVNHSNASVFFREAQSERFSKWLESVTGIGDFIQDEQFFGAGFHQTGDGGFLNVHVDFNKLPNGLDRRLNLLVYMNKEWKQDWGGELELWDMAEKQKLTSIAPTLNRAVIFETNEISFHGQPNPVNTHGQATRNSFSVYYYTHGRPPEEQAPSHNTIYVNTEGSKGKTKILFNSINQILTLKPLRRRIATRKQSRG